MKKLLASDAYHTSFVVVWVFFLVHINPNMLWTGIVSSCIISLVVAIPIAGAVRLITGGRE